MPSTQELVDVLLQAFGAEVVDEAAPAETPPSLTENLDVGEEESEVVEPTETFLSLTENLDVREEESGISFVLRICRYEDGHLLDVMDARCFFPTRGVSLKRWAAYWNGLLAAVPALAANAEKKFGWFGLPELFKVHARLLLDESCRTREQFAERTADPALFDILDELYKEFLKEARPEPRHEIQRRRDQAYEEAMARFLRAAAHVRQTHGLLLPKHIALGWALIQSFSPAEREAFDAVFVTKVNALNGVFPLFQGEAAARAVSPGTDARLHLRTSYTPPEMLPLFLGSQPGVFSQYGLFYDDPAFLPCGIASVGCDAREMQWHRGSCELEWSGETFFDLLREHVEFEFDPVDDGNDGDDGNDDGNDGDDDGDYPERDLDEAERARRKQERRRRNHRCRLIAEAMDDFAEHEARIREEDRARMRWSFAERKQMAPIASGRVGIATDHGGAEGLAYLQELSDLNDLWMSKTEQLRTWIREAEDALLGGDPRYALALGRDIYAAGERSRIQAEDEWFDEGAAFDAAISLLKPAYEALGRDAVARIAELSKPPPVDTGVDDA